MTIQGQNPVTDPTAMTNQVASTATKPAANPSIDGLANENTFLQLLVAQIKNQDPTNPTDSVQFLSQLAQFSQLEQLIGIRQELQPAASTTSTTDQTGGTNATTGTTNLINEFIIQKRRLRHVFFNSTFRTGREQHGLGRGR